MARRRTIIAAIAAASFSLAGTAAGQGYPDRIVEFVVPSTPGASAISPTAAARSPQRTSRSGSPARPVPTAGDPLSSTAYT